MFCFDVLDKYHDVSVSKGTFQSTGMFLYFLGSPCMEPMGKPPLIDTINEKEEQKHDLGGILLSVATSRRLWSHKGLLQIYKDSTNIMMWCLVKYAVIISYNFGYNENFFHVP